MFVPVFPGVAAGEFGIDVFDGRSIQLAMQCAVVLDQKVAGAAVETQGWQAVRVHFQAGQHLHRAILHEIKLLRRFFHEALHLRHVGDAAVRADGGERIGMQGPESQRAITTHRQAADEAWRAGAVWLHERRRRRHLLHDPARVVGTGMVQVAAAVAPQAVGWHRQHHRRQALLLHQPRQHTVCTTAVKPGPMAAIDTMQQCHERQLACADSLRHEKRHIRSPLQCR